jgi:hypothetical protein
LTIHQTDDSDDDIPITERINRILNRQKSSKATRARSPSPIVAKGKHGKISILYILNKFQIKESPPTKKSRVIRLDDSDEEAMESKDSDKPEEAEDEPTPKKPTSNKEVAAGKTKAKAPARGRAKPKATDKTEMLTEADPYAFDSNSASSEIKKPAARSKTTSKAAPAKPKKASAPSRTAKARKVQSSDEESEADKAEEKEPAPTGRARRGVAVTKAKPSYVELDTDDEASPDDGTDDDFELSS